MSGFLRRLAEGVGRAPNPRAAVRPFPESLYGASASSTDDAPGAASSLEQVTTERAYPRPHEGLEERSLATEATSFDEPAARSSPFAPPRAQRSPSMGRRWASEDDPATTAGVEWAGPVSTGAMDDDSSAASSPRPGAADADSEATAKSAPSSSPSPLASVLSRLMPPEVDEPPSSEEKPVDRRSAYEARAIAGAVARAARAQSSGASRAHDVHIHIGRIEVLAPPAALRPTAAAPVRTGPSLDAYLRRRNGNGGPA